MNDSILRKYTGTARGDEKIADELICDGEGAEDLGSFGWLRGVRDRAIMLELRKRSGNVVAIGYGWIERIEFDASEGITLHALGQKIRIRGHNLNGEARPQVRLFQGLCRNRVPWIQEGDRASVMRSDKNQTVIELIDVV